jgi:hypothetical protein
MNGYRRGVLRVLCLSLALTLGLAPAFVPAAGTADVHGIVDGAVQCLLGASEDGRWLAANTAAPRLTGGELYRLVGVNSVDDTVPGSAAKPAGEPCEDTLTVTFPALAGAKATMIGISAPTWPLQPRPVARLSPDNATYVEAVRETVVRNGIAQPEVRLAQVLRTDLDGNGTDEVLIAAHRYATDPPSSDARAGDYALILARQIVDGRVATSLLHAQFHQGDEEFSAPDVYTLAAVADLNGDGVMEVVVRGRYYEGEWADVFEFKGGRLETVLTCGCGL